MKVKTDIPKLNRMIDASLESIAWRQDRYDTGGIVESDERVDEGRKLYWPWCWPRTFVVKPLLDFGEIDRVKKFLGFWKNCQGKNGSWLHCYDVRDYSPYPGSAKETDNIGYILWHIFNYYDYTKDIAWLRENYQMVERAVKYLLSLYSDKYKLIWGVEECSTTEGEDWPSGYSIHTNVICAKGIESASKLAIVLGKKDEGEKWLKYAENIKEAINATLWDSNEKHYLFGISEDGKQRKSVVLWFNIMPTLMKGDWSRKDEENFLYLKGKLYNHDPKLPGTYWLKDYRPILNAKDSPCFNYSGVGPWIGATPVVVDILLRAGFLSEASQQMNVITKYTSDENNLIPEHINTIHPGKLGNYNIYPNPYYYVDSGNLLHLSFFLTMITTMIGRDDINKNVLWPKLPENINYLRVNNLKMKDGYLSYQYEVSKKSRKITITPAKNMELVVYLQQFGDRNRVFVNGKSISDFQVVETYSKQTKYLKLDIKIDKKTIILISGENVEK